MRVNKLFAVDDPGESQQLSWIKKHIIAGMQWIKSQKNQLLIPSVASEASEACEAKSDDGSTSADRIVASLEIEWGNEKQLRKEFKAFKTYLHTNVGEFDASMMMIKKVLLSDDFVHEVTFQGEDKDCRYDFYLSVKSALLLAGNRYHFPVIEPEEDPRIALRLGIKEITSQFDKLYKAWQKEKTVPNLLESANINKGSPVIEKGRDGILV